MTMKNRFKLSFKRFPEPENRGFENIADQPGLEIRIFRKKSSPPNYFQV
jgi:hypothetical protein